MKTVLALIPLALIGVIAAAAPLPEIRIVTGDAGLWSSATGIYANPRERGADWEREAFWAFQPAGSNETTLRTRVGLRIHGGRSRDLDQKSLRIYFDHGDGPVSLDLFDGPQVPLSRLIMRSVQTPDRMLHSMLAESLFRDQGHLGIRQAPALVTLNDRDWGLYGVRERPDPEWVTVTLGHADSFDLIRDGETRHGDADAWWTFLASFGAPDDRTTPDWLARTERQLDLDAYIDWLVILVFGATADNGDAHNLVLLRLDDGPWRPLLWDADDLFRPANLHADHLRWFSAADEAEYRLYRPPLLITGDHSSRAPWADLFRGLLENPGFRARFFDRCDELLAGDLSPDRLGARLDAVVARHEPGLARHAARWGWSGPDDLHAHAAAMKEWIAARHAIVQEQLAVFRDRYR